MKIHKALPFRNIQAYSSHTLLLATATVRAGFPSPATDYGAEPIDLNRYLSDNPTATFLVEVTGDSMIGAHVVPGSLAVVDKAVAAKSGHMVLAYVWGDFTVKWLDIRQDGAYLVPDNPNYQEIKAPDDCIIWGVVVGLAHRLSRRS
ncbi:LexA family protein [Pontibacter mangrovi]|nr:translesion error-prone DNA polymerase V autoproteolytic subunit [Pontibacter mangrovi]